MALDAVLGRAEAYEGQIWLSVTCPTRVPGTFWLGRPKLSILPNVGGVADRVGRDCVVRCWAASFGVARQMQKGEGPDSRIVTLKPCAEQSALIRKLWACRCR